MQKRTQMNRYLALLMGVLVYRPFGLEATRLRFILENNTKSNLFACLRGHDCDPLLEAEMPPGTRENIFSENFSNAERNFVFKLRTNSEETSYEVRVNPATKTIVLYRAGVEAARSSYNPDKRYPILITIGKELDAIFVDDPLYKRETTGMTVANERGYRPSLYLGDGGEREPRPDQNRFCNKKNACRKDINELSSYAGICNYQVRPDNLNPFCKSQHCKATQHRCKKCK